MKGCDGFVTIIDEGFAIWNIRAKDFFVTHYIRMVRNKLKYVGDHVEVSYCSRH